MQNLRYVGNNLFVEKLSIKNILKKNKIVAEGHFVHVYVDRKNRKPTKINPKFRAILKEILVN